MKTRIMNRNSGHTV